MHPIHRISIPEQVAAILREGIQQGLWCDSLPGENLLAAELDVSRNTVRRALQILQKESVLGARGQGRSRGITTTGAAMASQRPLSVAILRHEAYMEDTPQANLVVTNIRHSLEAAGYRAFECNKSQLDLKHRVPHMAKQLITSGADAWVVVAALRPMLEWCAAQEIPCLALYGRTEGLSLARTGPDTLEAYRVATRKLIELGHRRIVLIVREGFRRPPVGGCELAFLNELREHGIPTSVYNLPDWEETPDGFSRLMASLFKTTPPTAMIIDEVCWFTAALAFLVQRGIRVPEQVSLISGECEPILEMCHPRFAHIRWDNRLIVRRVVRWMNSVRKGKADRKVINISAEFVPGGSIGPVCKG